jgi:hypothetical protein
MPQRLVEMEPKNNKTLGVRLFGCKVLDLAYTGERTLRVTKKCEIYVEFSVIKR